MKTFKFTAAIAAIVGAAIEAKDYMHIAINENGQFAIYIWDTREVLATGVVPEGADLKKAKKARDNHQPLVNLPEGFVFEFPAPAAKAKLPRCKYYTKDGKTIAYRKGFGLILGENTVIGMTKKDKAEAQNIKGDNETAKAVIAAIEALSATDNKEFKYWLGIEKPERKPRAKKEEAAPAEAAQA